MMNDYNDDENDGDDDDDDDDDAIVWNGCDRLSGMLKFPVRGENLCSLLKMNYIIIKGLGFYGTLLLLPWTIQIGFC